MLKVFRQLQPKKRHTHTQKYKLTLIYIFPNIHTHTLCRQLVSVSHFAESATTIHTYEHTYTKTHVLTFRFFFSFCFAYVLLPSDTYINMHINPYTHSATSNNKNNWHNYNKNNNNTTTTTLRHYVSKRTHTLTHTHGKTQCVERDIARACALS